MRSRSLTVLGTGLGLALILSSCAYHTQTTSGSQYLARYAGKEKAPAAAASSGAASGTAVAAPAAIADSEILAAADVEPTLTFPARIGIARIDYQHKYFFQLILFRFNYIELIRKNCRKVFKFIE